MQEHVDEIIDSLDEAMIELAEVGCSPLETASAFISTGLRELDPSEENPAQVAAVIKVLLTRATEILAEIQRVAGGSGVIH